MKQISLRLKSFLIACFLLGALSVLTYAVANTYAAYTQMVVEQQQRHLLITARAVSQNLELYISDHIRNVETLTRTPGFLKEFRLYYEEGTDCGLKEYLLSYMLSQQQGVSRMYLLDREGREIYRYNQYPFLEEFDEAQLLLSELSARKQSGIGSVFRITPYHYGFTLVNGVIDENNYVGTVVCVLDMNALYQQFVAPLDMYQTRVIVVKDDEGTVIMHPEVRMLSFNPFWDIEQLDTLPQYNSLYQTLCRQYTQEEGVSVYRSFSNGILPSQEEISAFSRMNYGGNSWYVSAIIPHSEVAHLIDDNMGRFTLLVAAIAIVVGAGILIIYTLQRNRRKLQRETDYLKTMNQTLEELHHSREQVRHYQKLQTIGALAGGIVHEFNNLLTPIMGYSEFLKEQLGEDSEYYEDMDEIYRAGTRAKEIVDQILPFSRRETDSSGYYLVSMDAVLQEAVKMVRMIVPSNIRIETDIDGLRANVFGSATQLHQVLLNLCSNAYQSMEREGGILTVTARSVPAEECVDTLGLAPGWVWIQISDTGCGIAQEDISHIFDPFFTTKSIGEGTGLGLSVVQDILISHGGQITAESVPGQGSRFTVRLPISDAPSRKDDSF